MKACVSGPKKSLANTSTNVFSDISLMSAPAAKAFSEPVSTMQRTLSFCVRLAQRLRELAQKLWFSAFSASGRFSLISATCSSISTMIVLYAIPCPPECACGRALTSLAGGSSHLWQSGQ